MSSFSSSPSPYRRLRPAPRACAFAFAFAWGVLATIALATHGVTPAVADATPAPIASSSPSPSAAADAGDPCLQLSNLVSRPSFSTAACVVGPKALLLQTGYQNLTTSGSNAGTSVTYPQENLSIGVAKHLEFDLDPPSIARASGNANARGVTDGSIGAKLELGQTKAFIYAVNVLYTLQSGTAPFTGAGDGILVDLDGNYSLTPALAIFASFGYNAQSAGMPGKPARYHDVQPSLGASLSLPQSFTFYAEGFDESSTGPGTGGTFAYDTGLQKEIGSRLQLDAEIFGYPDVHAGGRQHALGFGAAYLFGS